MRPVPVAGSSAIRPEPCRDYIEPRQVGARRAGHSTGNMGRGIGFKTAMSPLPMMASAALSAGALLSGSCGSPAGVIHPVIYADDDQAAAAMRNAPLILLVRIADVRTTGDVRSVAKPPEVGGPDQPTIPLHLARINADVLLTVRDTMREPARTTVQFHSWVWASGKHGGPRLFHPDPGGIRVVFLREEGGYLHTVGDYPSYDLPLRPAWVPAMVSAWKSWQASAAGPLERLVAFRLRAEIEGLTDKQLRDGFGHDGPKVNHHWVTNIHELVRLVGPLFVVTQLDGLCLRSGSPPARFAACFVTAEYFPGRCEAYQIARKATADGFRGGYLDNRFTSCQASEGYRIRRLWSDAEARTGFHGARTAPQHRRETMRVYASAMDRGVRRAACELAAAIPEARDLPECTGSPK